MSVEIRKAIFSDAAMIGEICRPSILDAHRGSSSLADLKTYIDQSLALEVIQKELLDEKNLFHLLYVEGIAAGFSKIIPNSPNPKVAAQNVLKLERIYFRKEFFGQKLGYRLFNHIVQEASRREQAGIWLTVWPGNHRAIQFYDKLGFKIIGETLFRLTETRSNPNHWMYLKLT